MNAEANNFVHFIQLNEFEKSCDKDDLLNANFVRKNLILTNLMSRKWQADSSTYSLLEAEWMRYAKIIDEKEGINNYSNFVSSMARTKQINENVFGKLGSSLEYREGLHVHLPACQHNNSIDKWNVEYSKCTSLEKLKSQPNVKENEETSTCNSGINRQNLNFEVRSNPSLSRANITVSSIKEQESRTFVENSNVGNVQNQKSVGVFRTAADEYKIQNNKKYGVAGSSKQENCVPVKRTLGVGPRSIHGKFVPPYEKNLPNESPVENGNSCGNGDDVHPALKNIDPKMIELIKNEIMDKGSPICWDDIAGLTAVKYVIQEIVVLPLLRPDIFTGIRQPPKGILLFGPPGTGKTLIGKCVASQVKSTFFSISASSLTSKWIGESEKMVRALFAVARCYQPSVIFIDEIDSLLCQRSESEHESSRRLKTEFLVQLDGATTGDSDRVLVIGATNRPQELDEAARRRFVKRLYIPLPDLNARSQIVSRLMSNEKSDLTEDDIAKIAAATSDYSGADMANLCKEASLGPIRSIDISRIGTISLDEVRATNANDFLSALNYVRSSVSLSDIDQYVKWDKTYGSTGQRPI